MSVKLILLRLAARRCRILEAELEQERAFRDREALKAIERGHTWREVADAAGFANPYIAALKRKALAPLSPKQSESEGG